MIAPRTNNRTKCPLEISSLAGTAGRLRLRHIHSTYSECMSVREDQLRSRGMESPATKWIQSYRVPVLMYPEHALALTSSRHNIPPKSKHEARRPMRKLVRLQIIFHTLVYTSSQNYQKNKTAPSGLTFQFTRDNRICIPTRLIRGIDNLYRRFEANSCPSTIASDPTCACVRLRAGYMHHVPHYVRARVHDF